MAAHAWFRDAVTKTGRSELTDIVYSSKAGNLLEVVHDLEALKEERSAEAWKELWSERRAQCVWPRCNGVWARHEMVLPDLPLEHIVSLGEGMSPLQPAPVLARKLGLGHLWVKQCGTSHTGSFKDLGMTVLVSQVNHLIKSGKADLLGVACASTGDTSAALAAYCAAAGIPAVVLLPAAKISPAQLVQPQANGALTLALDTDFDGCMRLVKELTQDKRLYLANSMNSLRVEGQKTVGIEICEQLAWEVPEWIVIPGGNLGNISALYKGLSELLALGIIDRMPRLVCAQADAANPLYRSFKTGWKEFQPMTAQPTLASAIRIGDPVSLPKAIEALKHSEGLVESVSEGEIAQVMAEADLTGLYCCPHTAVALAAARKLAKAGTLRSTDRVVVVSTAHGLKFSESKAAYHAKTLAGIDCALANPPVPVAATPSAVYAAVERLRNQR